MPRNRVILNLFYHSICLQVTQTQIGNKQIGYKIDQKCICLEVTIWMIKVHISLFCTKQFLNSQSQPFRCSNAAVEAWRRLQTVEKSLGRNLFLQGCLLQNVLQCVLQSKLIVFLGQWRHITRAGRNHIVKKMASKIGRVSKFQSRREGCCSSHQTYHNFGNILWTPPPQTIILATKMSLNGPNFNLYSIYIYIHIIRLHTHETMLDVTMQSLVIHYLYPSLI